MDNTDIARQLLAHAARLDHIDPNLYRRRAFRRAAESVLAEQLPVTDLLRTRGRAGLRALTGIGDGLARAIEELVRTGEISFPLQVIRTPAGAVSK